MINVPEFLCPVSIILYIVDLFCQELLFSVTITKITYEIV